MKKQYYLQQCPVCKQDWLYITKDVSHNRIYLHCNECEHGWLNPKDIKTETAFMTLLQDYEVDSYPDEKDIIDLGWADILSKCETAYS